ncbi:MAG: dodecin family protein [Pyrinomonadaceae bacterium]|nr:dodecin family protein [Pyrinomonadaceae bacterium]
MGVAKVVEIISSSKEGFDDAVKIGVERACKTLENVKSAWVKDQKVKIVDGKVSEFRVTLKISFVLED